MGWTKLLFQIINLAVMLFILYRLFFKSVLRALDKRSTTVTRALDEAERRTREAIDTCGESQERMSKIAERIALVSQEANEELWRTRTRVLAETRHEIETMRESAEREMERDYRKKRYDYRCKLADLVTTQSGYLIQQAGGSLFQRLCIERFLEQLSALSPEEVHGVSPADREQEVQVRIISADVLDTEQVAQLEQQIQAMVGKPVHVLCRVDRALVAGAAIHVGDMVIDGSLAGSLHGLYNRYVADLQAIDQNLNGPSTPYEPSYP
jgi:F-type H+-transporting ATPase subunit b